MRTGDDPFVRVEESGRTDRTTRRRLKMPSPRRDSFFRQARTRTDPRQEVPKQIITLQELFAANHLNPGAPNPSQIFAIGARRSRIPP